MFASARARNLVVVGCWLSDHFGYGSVLTSDVFLSMSNKCQTSKILSFRCPPDRNAIAMKREAPITADCADNHYNRDTVELGDGMWF